MATTCTCAQQEMLHDDERNLPEETQLFFGLIDKHRGTKRKMLDVQSAHHR